MSQSWHVTAFGSWDADLRRLILDKDARVNAEVAKLHPVPGDRFVVRVEREADAKTHAQLRLYFRAARAISDYTGYSVIETHELLKAALLPPDVPASLAQCSKEQLSQLIEDVFRYSAEVVGLVLEDAARDDIRRCA